jgi:hypothetical protein
MGPRESALGKRVFTIELNSRSSLNDVIMPGGPQRVVIEGTIGILRQARFVDEAVLELLGSEGVLRVDLTNEDLTKGAQNRR